MPLRRTPQTVQVLCEFLDTPTEWRHGYDLSRCSGLKSGTLYPILIRLTENQMLDTKWEISETGKPPRHLYRLTQAGKRFARECVAETQGAAIKKPVFGV